MATMKQHDDASDDFDFDVWSPVTKATLIEKELWDVVENGVPTDPSKNPELAAKIQREELSKWRDLVVKDKEALKIMQSSLPDSAFRETLSASSAKEVWDLLQKGNTESKDSYSDKVKEIIDKYGFLNVEINDYHTCKKIFESKLKSYSGTDSILKELTEVHNMTDSELHMLLFLKKGFEYDLVTKQDYLEILHDARVKSETDEDIWMVYDGLSTFHMTPHEKCFTTLDRTYKVDIVLDDGRDLKVGGKGDVKIKMKGGKKKTIKDVVFVPELNRNVLSLEQLRSRGYALSEGREGLCIIRDRTGEEFGETLWKWEQEKGFALRLNVIQAGNLTS